MIRKKLIVLAGVAAIAAVGVSTAMAQALTLRFAMITAEAFPYMDGAKKFKELVEERSKGDIKVLLYPGGQLGNERQINEAILEGPSRSASEPAPWPTWHPSTTSSRSRS